MSKEYYGFLWGVIAAITGSAMGLFVKLSVGVPVTTLVFIRFFLAMPIIAFLLVQKKAVIEKKSIPKHLTRSLAGLGALYCFYAAIRYLDLVNAITLRNSAPLFMPLIAFFWWKIVVTKRRMIALVIGFLGVVILLQPSGNFFKSASMLGVVSAALGALAMMSIRQLSKTESTAQILTYYFFICTCITFVPMLLNFKWIDDPFIWIYVFCAGLSALIFQYTITKAYTYAPATKVSTVSYLGVFLGGLYGWLFLGEIPTAWTWGGALLIIIGAIMALTDPHQARRRG